MKFILYTTLIVILFSSCQPKSCEQHIAFQFPMTITPQDTFNVGDTIWHEMELPQELFDKNSGEYIKLKDFDLSFEMDISRWEATQIIGGSLDFEIVEDIVSATQIIDRFVYTTLAFESTVNRHLRFGLIPKVAGKYSEGVDFPEDYYYKEQLPDTDPERFRLTDSPCSQFMMSYSGVRINDGVINYYLIENLCKPSGYSGDTFCMAPYEVVANDGVYVFVVR